MRVDSGTYLSPGRPNGVLVEKHTADHFHLAPGDRVQVGGVRLRVLGVATSPEYYWPALNRQNVLPAADDFGVLFVPERLARHLAGLQAPNQVGIYYRGGEENAALTAQLTRRAERSGATSAETRAQQPSNSALQQDVRAFRQLAILFPLLFLTAAALATAILMRRVVTAQTPTIGMLRACGYSRRQVVAHYLSFGIVVGLLGGGLGAVSGLGLAGQLTKVYTRELSIPVALTSVSPLTPLVGLAFGLLTGVASASIAACVAAQVAPAEAMRRFVPAAGGRLSIFERLLPPLRRLPIRWRMVLRSLGRNRRRNLATGIGVVLALMLILVSWGMIDTTELLIDRQFKQIERQDAQLYFDRPGSRRRGCARSRGSHGVQQVEPALDLPVSIAANGRRYQTSLVGLQPHTQPARFPGRGRRRRAARSGLLAGQALRAELGIDAGDRVQVDAIGGGQPLGSP